ncbi:MAG TPA: arsenate reductase ArsC [Thermoplasmata archaeon]|nr:arsenate reductase ArsC [Thermoplasmata archaeon]
MLRPSERVGERAVRPRRLLLLLLRRRVLLNDRMGERWVVFVCVENACRSLMAEAAFNANAPDGWRATSAGTRPAEAANPRTGPMLAEVGLELPRHRPTVLTPALLERAGIAVSMGCLDEASCPAYLSGPTLRDWELEDPGRLDDDGFRRVRDQVIERVRSLRLELKLAERRGGAGAPAPAP